MRIARVFGAHARWIQGWSNNIALRVRMYRGGGSDNRCPGRFCDVQSRLDETICTIIWFMRTTHYLSTYNRVPRGTNCYRPTVHCNTRVIGKKIIISLLFVGRAQDISRDRWSFNVVVAVPLQLHLKMGIVFLFYSALVSSLSVPCNNLAYCYTSTGCTYGGRETVSSRVWYNSVSNLGITAGARDKDV